MENLPLVALFVLSLEKFDNTKLAALNNVVSFTRNIPRGNIAYTQALEEKLIDDNGNPIAFEELRDACAYEVNRRVAAGTFN